MQTSDSSLQLPSKKDLPKLKGKWGYLLAAGMVSLALASRVTMDRHWGDRMPYTTFFVASLVCISLTEVGPAFCSIIAGLFLANWYFVSPGQSGEVLTPERFLKGFLYLTDSGIVLSFATWARRALERERTHSDALQRRSLELEASEKRFHTLAEAAFEGILVSQNGRIIDCNDQLGAMVGHKREELLGKQATDFIAPLQRATVQRNIREELPASYELELLCKDGSRRAVEAHGRPIRGSNGEALRVSVVRDVTVQKGRELALRRQAALIDLSPDAIFVREPGGKILFWSKGAENLYGWSKEEAVGQQTNDLLQTRYPETEEAIKRELEQGGRWTGELEHRTKTGLIVKVQSRWLGMEREQGKEILESNLDISERKRSEETMRRRTEELERLMDALPAAVWIAHDRECKTVTGNRSANELVGVKAGTNVSRSGPAEGGIQHFKGDGTEYKREELPLQRAARTGQPVHGAEVEFRLAGDKRAWMLGSAEPLFDAEGVCRGAVAAFVDETEQKEAEEALRAARDELALANDRLERRVGERTRSLEEKTAELNAFCYSLAHDFRAPIRTQEGFARILIEEYGENLGEKGLSVAWRVLQAAKRQSDIIQDLLAHISVTRSELPLEELSLKESVEQARADLALELQDRKAEIKEEDLEDAKIMANRSSLHLVLLNLLTNAFKFVAPDSVPIVRLRTERRGELVRVWIEDNGIGISTEDIGKLFSMFRRLNPNVYPGTGMGLAIVKKAAERMGGHVGVESEPGKGSRFWVELKAATS